jgi:hypothetical protein
MDFCNGTPVCKFIDSSVVAAPSTTTTTTTPPSLFTQIDVDNGNLILQNIGSAMWITTGILKLQRLPTKAATPCVPVVVSLFQFMLQPVFTP